MTNTSDNPPEKANEQQEKPNQLTTWPSITRTVLMLAVLVGLALGLRAARGVAAPVLLGLVLAVGTSPLIGILIKRHVPPVLAYIITIIVIVIVIGGVLSLVSFMILQMSDLLPTLQDQLTAAQERVGGWLSGYGVNLNRVIEDQVLNPENIIGWISTALEQVYNALRSISLVILIVAFMLVEATGFRVRFYAALGEDRPALRRWIIWSRDTRSYLWITTVLAIVVSIFNFVLLLALRVPYPFTWAFLSFIMSYIPSVGFIIALVPPVALSLIVFRWGAAIGVFVGYIVINFVSDNILKPRILKTGMDLPVAVSFLSVLVWGFVLGPMGALLSVPMTIMVRTIFLEAAPETEQMGLLLRSGAAGVRTKKRLFWWLRRHKTNGPPPPPPTEPPESDKTAKS